jgi:virulence factor Mce-like protein
MGKTAPTFGQIAVAVAFAFSCFGLLLFLWTTFGGPVPLKPEGYRITVPVNEATTLAQESDVRISGVSVGRVKDIKLEDNGENRDLALATIEIDDSYAPLPNDTRATLRQKTLLGESYMELSQGDPDSGTIEEGGTLPKAQVGASVQLDEIVRTFDARTRAAFQTWMQQAAIAFKGRGDDVSAAIANLEPFAEDANKLLRVLDSQDQAVSQFVNNTGVVFSALSERQGQLRGLIANSGTVFKTTAKRDEELRQTFRAFPTFLDESRLTLDRLKEFSLNANPLITQLHPSAKALSGTLKQVARVSPDLKNFFIGFRKVAKKQGGLPAVRRLLDNDLPPILNQIQPFTQQLTPIIEGVGRYQRDVTGLLANGAAATNAIASATEAGGTAVHYIRSSAPAMPEGFATFPLHRLESNRPNPYVEPNGMLKLANGLEVFDNRHCTAPPGVIANLDPATPTNPNFIPRAYFIDTPQDLFDNINKWAFRNAAGNPVPGTGTVARPPCNKQAPQPSIGQIPELTDYPHVYQYAP